VESVNWWNRLVARFSAPGIEPSGAAILTTSYGLNGNEQIVPSVVAGAREAYIGNAVVFGAVLARLSLFSEAVFCFRDLEDKSLSGMFEQDGRRNTGLRKLENPWPNGTTGELLVRMIQDADLAGNAFIWDAGTQLVRLRPEWVTIISELVSDVMGRPFRRVIGFFYDPAGNAIEDYGPPQFFTVDEVVHWAPNPDPYASFRGMSWLTPVFRDIAGDAGMTNYKIKYLENAASPNLLIKYSTKIGQTTVNKLRDRISDLHAGQHNAFKTLILDEGADATVIGNSFEQMNFSTVQAAGENRIIIASGVPGIVIGTKEGLAAATYSNYEQAMRRFADITMRPLWRSACAALSSIVTIPPGKKLWFDVSDIAALRQGEKEQADTMLVLAQAAGELVSKGFEPQSVVSALSAGDMTLLKWKGLEPVNSLPPKPETPALPAGPPMMNGVTKKEPVAA
jgi:hypothetical protein